VSSLRRFGSNGFLSSRYWKIRLTHWLTGIRKVITGSRSRSVGVAGVKHRGPQLVDIAIISGRIANAGIDNLAKGSFQFELCSAPKDSVVDFDCSRCTYGTGI